MNLSLKNVKIMRSLSEETICFSATIYIDGKKACNVSNRGNGGCHDYDDWNVQEKIAQYAATLPTVQTDMMINGKPFSYQPDADTLITDMVVDIDERKELKALLSSRFLYTRHDKDGLFQTKKNSKEYIAEFSAFFKENPINPKIRVAVKAAQMKDLLNAMDFEDALLLYRGRMKK